MNIFMSLQSWCQNHTIPPMKEDWMEWYMNINKLMRMIINKMKGYLKDDQLGFKYQKSLHKEIKYEWTNDTVSICLPAWVRLDFDITTVQVLCGVPASNWQLYTCIYRVVSYCELHSINKCTTISHNLNTWDLICC